MNGNTDIPIKAEEESLGWRARLELGYTKNSLRTVISHKKHLGPLLIQKPFYPENNVCHTYLIHPPGGIVGGDKLQLLVLSGSDSHALVTTPAANKFYRSAGNTAKLEQTITLEDNATFEWLPQENILFNGSKVDMTTRINIENKVRFIGWEMTCLGRPASNDNFSTGEAFQKFEVWQHQKPRLLDRVQYQSEGPFRTEKWAMGSKVVSSSMVALPADKDLLSELREYLSSIKTHEIQIAATLIEDMLVCRGVASDAELLRETLFSIWALIRPRITGKLACRPRIWDT
ncbi:MAG: urease accessory protein UreD [Gammaproteobacteria bacterium]